MTVKSVKSFTPPYVGKRVIHKRSSGYQVNTYGHNGWLCNIVSYSKITETFKAHKEIIEGQEPCS